MERLIHLLVFSGLCLLIGSISCEFVLIPQQKTWDEAQLYCRQNHFDLATVHSIEDWTNVQRAVGPALTSDVWTGLYNDIHSWRWSHLDEKVTAVLWGSEQPNNLYGKQECVYIEYGGCVDFSCLDHKPMFCYNEQQTGENRFVFISENRTWPDAQSYCRQYYTDLATVNTQAEYYQLMQMMSGVEKAWIGLFRDSWKWSDGAKFYMSSINWMSSTRNITGQTRPCGAASPDGLIDDRDCRESLPFICKRYQKKQIVRVEMKSGQGVNYAAMMENILQLIKQKLKDGGIEQDTTLTWRLQPDGNVFIPKHDRTAAAEEMDLKQEGCSEIYF